MACANCVFCLKSIDGESGLGNSDSFVKCVETTVKFLKFLQRHLKCGIHHVNQQSTGSLLIKRCDNGESTSFDIHSCSSCSQLMSHFLDLYNQLKVLELKVNWAMNSLVNVMSKATAVPLRVKAFNESLKISEDNDNEKNMKLNGIHDFRKDLIKKCNRYSEFSPRVAIVKPKTNAINTMIVCEKTFRNTSSPHLPLPSIGNGTNANVELKTTPNVVISVVLIAVITNYVKVFLSSLPNGNSNKSAQTIKTNDNVDAQILIQEVAEEKNGESDLNSEPEPYPIDTDDRSPGSCVELELEGPVPEHLELDRCCSPIPMTSAQANTSTSALTTDDNRRGLRARKRFFCNKCSESFSTSLALVSHQETSHNDPLEVTDEESEDMYDEGNQDSESLESDMDTSSVKGQVKKMPFVSTRKFQYIVQKRKQYDSESSTAEEIAVNADFIEKTEEEIIQHYANNEFKFIQRYKSDSGKFLIVQSPIKLEQNDDTCIKTLSQYLTPVQQRLTAALLHKPKFSCNFNNCTANFVFEDLLQNHSKLHGEFLCGLCSHVETYALKLAEHALAKHCTTIRRVRKFDAFVSCGMPRCASLSPVVKFTHRNYTFHYLTEHLNLDVRSVGCLICHYVHPNCDFTPHNHFQNFHGIFQMKPKDVCGCEKCPAFFCESGKLNLHMRAFHNQIQTTCPDCQKEVEDKSGLKNHRVVCKGRKWESFKHRCLVTNCGKTFRNLSGLVAHNRTCTYNPEQIWHDCSQCEKRYLQKQQLEKHLKIHKRKNNTGKMTKMKSCELCGKSVRADKYRLHMLLHSGPESWNHACPDCGKKFRTTCNLKVHMKRHEGNSQFVCKLCGVRYDSDVHLNRHMNTCFRASVPSAIDNNQGSNPDDISETSKNGADNDDLKTVFTSDMDVGSVEENVSEKTEEEIIDYYANFQFKFFQKTKYDIGKFLIVPPNLKGKSTMPAKETSGIKVLSEYLSPVQQRLTAAILYQPKFSCKFNNCIEKFVFKVYLETHSKLHGNFVCNLCSHAEEYAPTLAEHILTEHCTSIKRHAAFGVFVSCPVATCTSSKDEFNNKHYVFHYLTDHLNLNADSVGCPICHYIYPYGDLLPHNHFQMFHGIFNMKVDDVCQCASCPAFFCSADKLNAHMVAFHSKYLTSCPDCQKPLTSKNGFRNHRKQCIGRNQGEYSCSFPNCGKTFEHFNFLARHMKICTLNPEGVWFDSSKCKFRSRDEEKFQRHLDYHKQKMAKQRIYRLNRKKVCEVCGKAVGTSTFNIHMRYHSGPDSWKHLCPQCGKKCISPASLRDHMKTHTKDVSFVCQFCGAKYALAASLRVHLSKKHGHKDQDQIDTSEQNSTAT